MGIILQNNSNVGPDVELEVVVENDDGIFLGVTAEDEGGAVVWDYFTSAPSEIEAFFAMVAKAKADHDRLRGK